MQQIQQVFDGTGHAHILGDRVGGGAQGEVFALASAPDTVVKLFNDVSLAGDRGKALIAKLTALTGKNLARKFPEVAWPDFLVFDACRCFLGYAMQRVIGIPLVQNALAMKKLLDFIRQGNAIDRLILATTAVTFLETLRRLHAADVCVGDFNTANFLFDAHQGRISFIDADSYQVRVAGTGSSYPCLLTTEGMTAPEHLGKHVGWFQRTPESELFSGAIIVFMILMTGRHPFDAIGQDDYAASLQNNAFPYRPAGTKPTGCIPRGNLETVWNDFPLSLQEAFFNIFHRGYSKPQHRGTLEEFLAAILDYRTRLLRGEGIISLDVKAPLSPPRAARGLFPSDAPAPAGSSAGAEDSEESEQGNRAILVHDLAYQSLTNTSQ